MSRLQYTVTVRFDADAMDTVKIQERLEALSELGDIVETKAKAVSEKKTERRQSAAA